MQIGSGHMTTKHLLVHVPIIINVVIIIFKATNRADVAVSVILMHDLPSLLKLFSQAGSTLNIPVFPNSSLWVRCLLLVPRSGSIGSRVGCPFAF